MWYVASAFFKSKHLGQTDDRPALWEEMLLLIDATDNDDAARQAEDIARSKEHEYEVLLPTPHVVRWTLVKIERAHLVDGPLERGAEIFSRFLRKTEAESLLIPFED
jgi:hypothetical protein